MQPSNHKPESGTPSVQPNGAGEPKFTHGREPRRLSDEDLGGRALLEAAGLEPVDGWDADHHRTRCKNCDNDIETGGCRCARPEPGEPSRLEVLDCMQSMGGGFVAALAIAWMKADEDNDRRLRAAFPHYWKQYTEAVKLQKARVYGRVMKGGAK